MNDKLILLGEITGAHGIRGEVLVRTYTGDPEAIAGYNLHDTHRLCWTT